jgi:hypothetical protein
VNKAELAEVLAKIKLGDNREVNELVLREWFDTIGHLRHEDAIAAVTMHRQEAGEYLMPVHIIRNVRRVIDARVEAQKAIDGRSDDFMGDPKPGNWEAMCAAYKDPVAYERERAIYDEQLIAAGLAPTDPYKARFLGVK